MNTTKKNEVIPFLGFSITMLSLVSALSFAVNGLSDAAKTTLFIAIASAIISIVLNWIVNFIIKSKR